MRLLVINCGSATLKYKLFELVDGGLQVLAASTVILNSGYGSAVRRVIGALPAHPDAIAHRVVHGGDQVAAAVLVDDTLLGKLRQITSLAPLHNGPAPEGIEATLDVGVPLVAAFDTASRLRAAPQRAQYRARIGILIIGILIGYLT